MVHANDSPKRAEVNCRGFNYKIYHHCPYTESRLYQTKIYRSSEG